MRETKQCLTLGDASNRFVHPNWHNSARVGDVQSDAWEIRANAHPRIWGAYLTSLISHRGDEGVKRIEEAHEFMEETSGLGAPN